MTDHEFTFVIPAYDFYNEHGMETGVEFTGPRYTMDGEAPSYYVTEIINSGVYGLVGFLEGEWRYAVLQDDGEYIPGDSGRETFESAVTALLESWDKEYSDDRNA